MRVGRSSGADRSGVRAASESVVDAPNPGAKLYPTIPTRAGGPGRGSGIVPGGTGRCPGGGMSPGFGMAVAVVDATADGATEADAGGAESPVVTEGSGTERFPGASIVFTVVPTVFGELVEGFDESAVGDVESPHPDTAPAATSTPTDSPIAGLTMDRSTVVALFWVMVGMLHARSTPRAPRSPQPSGRRRTARLRNRHTRRSETRI